MQQFNDNPFAPRKTRAIDVTGHGSSYGMMHPNAGVSTGSHPVYGPGGGSVTSTPAYYTPPSLGDGMPTDYYPPHSDNPPQQYSGGQQYNGSSALHGTVVDAASRGSYGFTSMGGPSRSQPPIVTAPNPIPVEPPPTYTAPPNPNPGAGYNAPVPIDPPYGPGSGDPTNPYGTQPTQPTQTPPQLNREDWRDKWMSSGIGNIEGLKQFLSQYGGMLLSDNGTALTPFGEVLDLLIGAKTGRGTPGWTIPGGSGSINPTPTPTTNPTPTSAPTIYGPGDVKTVRQPAAFANAYGPQQWNPSSNSGDYNLLRGYY